MKKTLFIPVLMLVMISASVFALTASITNPKMVLYKNVTPEEPLVFDNSIILNNDNDFEVKVEIEPTGDLKDIAVMEIDELVLEPGETKEVFYTITINKPKIYRGDVIAKFSKMDANVGAALAQIIVVVVKGEGDFEGIDDPVVADDTDKIEDDTQDDVTDTTAEQTGDEDDTDAGDDTEDAKGSRSNKPNPIVGMLIFIVIIAVGLVIYFLIIALGGKK